MTADFGSATANFLWAILSITALTASTLTAYTVGVLRGGRQGVQVFVGLAALSVVVPGALIYAYINLPPGLFDR